MRNKAIVAGAVAIAILILVGIGFIAARQPSAAFTVRHIKSVQSGHLVTMTVEMTNHTSRSC